MTASSAPAQTGAQPLARSARFYLLAIGVAALAAAVPALAGLRLQQGGWLTFLILAACAAATWLVVVPTGRNHGFPVGTVFIIAAALLLPPQFVALMGIGQHIPDLVMRRYPWYIQSFNVSNYTLNALGAWATVHLVLASGIGSEDLAWAVAGFTATLVFVLLNHLLLASALLLARGHSFRESGLFSLPSLSTDFALGALGVALAAFWNVNPWLIPVAAAPLIVIHRSLSLLAALRESEERFRAIFESSTMGIRLSDLGGRVLASNRAFARMLGRTPEELNGMKFVDLTHPEDRDRDLVLFEEMVAGNRDSYELEKRYRRPDGSVIWGQLTGSLVRDADGKPQFAIGMVQDVTERKQLEEQLRQAQKMEAVGRLAGGIAHDFNNLLTVIETYSEFVLEELGDRDETLRKDVEEIKRAGSRAAALTGQLLALSRKQVLQPEVLDLNTVVSDTSKMLRRLIGEDLEIETRLAPDLGRVEADPGQIEQVLMNLIVNARDAMPRGGRLLIETANVDLTAPRVRDGVEAKPGSYVVLSVHDTGAGMDAATRSQIFEPFFTTKEKGKGTGLGLSTVYGIVAQSGGHIFVDSELGRGTALTVYLPRAVLDEQDVLDEPQFARASDGAETVLIVEDEDLVRGAARRILHESGYRVLEALDGSDGLRVTASHEGPIHLVVTDVVMPQMSGPELVERLAAERPETKVLYMSGYTDTADLTREVAEDGAAFLQKPFTAHQLADKVRALLDEAAEESTLASRGPAAHTAAAVAHLRQSEG